MVDHNKQTCQGDTMKLSIGAMVSVKGAPLPVRRKLVDMSRFDNPKWEENERRGYSNRTTPKIIDMSTDDCIDTVSVPRGLLNEAWTICHNSGQKVEVEWRTTEHVIESSTNIDGMRPYQLAAKRAFGMQGMIVLPCGAGKTYTACGIVGGLHQRTIILVHTEDLLGQWKESVRSTLGIDAGVYQGKNREVKDVTIGMVQSLMRRSEIELSDFFSNFGFVILDEAHHVPATQFLKLINMAPCKYRLGLTATPYRNDGMTPVLYAVFGEIAYTMPQEALINHGNLVRPRVEMVPTGCIPDGMIPCRHCFGSGCINMEKCIECNYKDDNITNCIDYEECNFCRGRGEEIDYNKLLEELTNDADRLQLVVGRIAGDIESGHSVLCLATRKEYLAKICEAVAEVCPQANGHVLTSDVPKGLRRSYIAEAREGKCRLICGTQLADEGLDIPRIDRIHLTLPTKAKSSTVQRIGRMMRPHEDKTDLPVLHDYVDDHPACWASWTKRRRHFAEIGAEFV